MRVEEAGLDAAAAVDRAVLSNANVKLLIPGYKHCQGPLPTMMNGEKVAPLDGTRPVVDSDCVEIGYLDQDANFVITKQCGEFQSPPHSGVDNNGSE